MIRRTVAKAFGPSGDENPRVDEAALGKGRKGSRVQLVNQLSADLHGGFERAVRDLAAARADGKAPGPDAAPAPQVTKPTPRPEGIEFLVEGAAGSFRFLNSMDGVVWVYREERRRFREDRLLTIHFEGEIPRVIERPVGIPRAPFRFTSVPQLVREILREVVPR